MCFITNGDLVENQRTMYKKIKTILENQYTICVKLDHLKNDQKDLNDKLDKILDQLTHKDKGE